MSDFNFENYQVNWENRSDSAFWAIDRNTYIANVLNVDVRPNRFEQPMAHVTFKFDEVRTTKTKPNGDTAVETEYGRELRILFGFEADWALEQAYKYLLATGVATPEELDSPEGKKIEFVVRKFYETQGKSVAVRVSKYESKVHKENKSKPAEEQQEDPYADPAGMKNGAQDFFAEGSRQYKLAESASGGTIDTSEVVTGGRKRRSS